MTDTEHEFHPVDGMKILASGVSMPGASGGLNKALAVNRLELDPGEELTLVVHAKVKELRFPGVKDTDGFQRHHVLQVLEVAPIDPDAVAAAVDEQRRKQEEAAGIQRLPIEDPDGPDTVEDDTP